MNQQLKLSMKSIKITLQSYRLLKLSRVKGEKMIRVESFGHHRVLTIQ